MGLTGKGISFIATFISRNCPGATQFSLDAAEGRGGVTEVCKSLIDAAGPNASHTLLGECDEVRSQNEEWLTFANTIHTDDKLKSTYLRTLDTYLVSRSVFVGVGTSTGIADVALFVSIHDQVAALPKEELKSYPNLIRWIDYVQHKDDQSQAYEWIPVERPTFNPPIPSSEPDMKKMAAAPQVSSEKEKNSTATSALTAEDKSNKKEVSQKAKASVSSDVEKKIDAKDVSKKDKKVADEPKEKKESAPLQKDTVGFDILDIRVGIIETVKKHPSADALYVEEINIGEGSARQVVSGLAKYFTEEQMLNRRVLVLANVKPSKLRDVMSAGLVLCASNEDHTQCEPVLPPEGASIGERVIVSGFEGKPEPQLNPKKKQWDKLYPDLHTDESGVACYQGKPLTTAAGVCTSSITKGSIK
ncbi:hypothetical protein R1flu_021306 [Riccia fluitans]|uniref:tRNA-binding domain-containing protein n=1 Tax=Riccia fluitans TaxID=41844 RepID=A0ABD1ZP77_9MARC